FCDVDGRVAPDAGELVAVVAVESLEPVGQCDGGGAGIVENRHAVVNVLHVGGFDEGVVEVLVGGVEGVIDLEGAAGLGEGAGDVYATGKVAGVAEGVAAAVGAVDADAAVGVEDA